jgi:hypothetical protein
MISMTCCRRWQTGGFIRMWYRWAATDFPMFRALHHFLDTD